MSKNKDNRNSILTAIDKTRFAKKFADVNASVAVTVDFDQDLVHVAVTNGAGIDKSTTIKTPSLDSVYDAIVTLTAQAHEDVKARFESPAKGLFIKAISLDSVRAELRRQVHASSKARNLAKSLKDDFDAEKARIAARKVELEKELESINGLV